MEDFINIRIQQQRAEDKRLAQIAMQTSSVLSRMFASDQNQFIFTDEFDWLFTPEEHREAKRRRLDNAIHVKEAP